MKNLFTLILFMSVLILNGQEIYEYEAEIIDKQKYIFEEIEVLNSTDKINLFGTLVMPKKEFKKVIIIVNGTGPHSRYAHNILTTELLENNFAVFRFDKRGVGKSEGISNSKVSSYVSDLTYLINSLKLNKNIQNKKIGLIGHSLGGLATIGSIEKGLEVDFLVQWSTPVGYFSEFIKYQFQSKVNEKDLLKMFKLNSVNKVWELITLVQVTVFENREKSNSEIYKILKVGAKNKGFKSKQYDKFLYSRDNFDLMKWNFDKAYIALKVPTLYIIGSADRLLDSKKSISIVNSFKNENITSVLFDGLNHYLTDKGEIRKKTIELYDMDDKAIDQIINWIKKT